MLAQIEEGITLDVAGGLMLEHPLISPFVEAVVSSLFSLSHVYAAEIQLREPFTWSFHFFSHIPCASLIMCS